MKTGFQKFFRVIAIVGVLQCPGNDVFAQGSYLTVASDTDGNGLFTYTFTKGSDPFVWGVEAAGLIGVQSHGIINVISPSGWDASVDVNEFVTWVPSSGIVFIEDVPLTFSILSASIVAVTYADLGVGDYTMGIIAPGIYSYPNHDPIAGGYGRFSFLGPAAIPEPCAFAIGAAGLILAALRLRRKKAR